MADFSVQATNLAAPQGAGSAPIAPVKEQYVNDSIVNSPAVAGIVDIFAKGLVQNRKDEAKAQESAVVGAYVQEETTLNNAVATGQISPSAAAARSRANFNKYAAGYSQYITEFEKAGKALRGFTEAGEVQDQMESAKKLRDADKASASNAGFTFTTGMSPEAEDSQIKAHKTNVRVQQQLEEQYKANAERRASGTFDASMADRDARETAIQGINAIAADNMSAFQAYGATLANDVKTGKTTPEQGQILLTERYANINAAIQSAARLNPELAGPYRSLFNESNDIFKKMLDPKNSTEDLENELKRVQTRLKLTALSDPKFAATVTVSNLLGNNPTISFASSSETLGAIARISQAQGGYAPQIVGNPDVEPGTLKILKSGLQQLKDPKTKNADAQKVEAENSVNAILKQTGQQLDLGASPAQLKGVADFFASPEYAGFVTSGKIDQQGAQAAKKTFQLLYEPAVVQGVQEKLKNFIGERTRLEFNSLGQPTNAEPIEDAKTVRDAVNVTFTGAGVSFSPKKEALTQDERRAQAAAVTELNTAQKALNQIIHIGAHMEGTTNYAKYWEDNKHIYLPSMFSKYKGLEIGDIKNGQRYLGGEANDPKSWKAVQ